MGRGWRIAETTRRRPGHSAVATLMVTAACFVISAGRAALAQTAPPPPPPPTEPTGPRFNPTGRDIELLVPVREGPNLVGQVRIRLGADDSLLAPVSGLEAVLASRMRTEALAAIRTTAGADGLISPEELAGLGVLMSFDPQAIELSLELPSDDLAPIPINLGGPPLRGFDRAFETPEFFSLATNIRASLDFVHTSGSSKTGLNAPVLDFEAFGRVGAIAYQNEALYDERVGSGLVRRGTRLIYDRAEQFLRFTLGDLFVANTSFQGAPDLAGLSVSRLIDEFPQGGAARPRGERSFSIDRPSEVRVLVNGQEISRLRLRPGSYDLRNFPFVTGANDVEVLIEDDLGQLQSLRFDFFLDGSLLTPGQTEYYAAAGVLSEAEGAEIRYRTEVPLVSAFLRRGVSDRITLGANIQATETNQVAGVETIVAPGLGLVFADFAVSNIEGFGASYAGRVDWRWSVPREAGGFRSVALSVESRGRRFGSVDATNADNQTLATVSARYSQTISPRASVSSSATWSFPRGDREGSGSASAGLFWSLGARTRVGVTMGYDVRDGEGEFRGLFTIRRQIGRRQGVSADYDTAQERFQLNYNYASLGGIGSYGASAGISHTPENLDLSATGTYVTARGDLSLSHTANLDEQGEVQSQITSLRAASAVALAGTRFGFGPTVGRAFAVLSPHESLGDGRIVVGGRFTDRARARSGLFGPALTSVPTYSPSTIAYDVENAPLGYNLGLGTFAVNAPLGAGYDLTVGSEFNVTVVGFLLDFGGEPIALQSGEALSLDRPETPPVEVFTNRTGRFGASGLAPGRWRIRLLTGEPLDYVIEVPSSQELILDVGRIRPRGAAEAEQGEPNE